jgi:hypothetical protein
MVIFFFQAFISRALSTQKIRVGGDQPLGASPRFLLL